MTPDRRSVLKGLGAAAVVVGGGVVGWRLLDDDDAPAAPATTEPPLEPTSSLAEALAAVGGRYLEVAPDEADEQVLLAALPALEGTVPERPGQDLRVLAPQASGDHATGEVIVLDGWVLSLTEARASALYAL
ncbi:MAG: twin-arginine translocation signal domain-containing protein [Acidimicrobiales bacterium]